MTEPDKISMSRAALEFGCSVQTIRRRIADGTLTGYRFGPRLLRVSRAELVKAFEPIPTAERAS